MTRQERLNNPTNAFKSELQHIEHTMVRMKERTGIELTLDQYYDLVRIAQKESHNLYSLNSSNSVKIFTFLGKEIMVIYGNSSYYKDTKIPGRIKTVLIPDWKRFPVPDKFARFDVSSEEFATDVMEVLGKAKEVAANIIPHITSKEFYCEPEFYHLSNIFKTLAFKWERLSSHARLSLGFREVLMKYEKKYES